MMPESDTGFADIDIARLLRESAMESMFGEGDPRQSLDMQRLDYLLRQESADLTAQGLGEYLMDLDERERTRLLYPYYLPREWRIK